MKENTKIKVSVIMPVYNSGKYLSTAVDSILNQSLREIELILVDDGSTDGSSEKCDEFASLDSRVVVIHQKNGGICNARNAALKIAKGEYIGFSDHDDEYMPGLLEDNYQLGIRNKVDIVKFGSHWELINGEKVFRAYDHKFANSLYSSTQVKDSFWKLRRGFLFNLVWDALFRRSFLVENNILFNSYFKTGGEDNDFMWQCVGAGVSLLTNENVYYNHYVRTGFSTSATYKSSSIDSIIERPNILLSDIKKLGISLEDSKSEYAVYWLERSLGSLCHVLSSPNCPLSKSEKIQKLKELKNQPSYRKWILKVSPFSILKLVPKQYALLQQFYKFGFYGLCLKLYQIQYKKGGHK